MKENIILLRPGRNRAVNLPAHSLSTAGFATFAVAGMDMDNYTQWSVIGARKNELIKSNENKVGCDQCRVHIASDQYTPTGENRIINVSVIGTDNTTKQQVEAKAILTVSIHPAESKPDFQIVSIEFPDHIHHNPDGTVVPADLKVKAHISEKVGSAAAPKFTGYVTVDVQGDHNHAATHEMTREGDTDSFLMYNLTTEIKGMIDACMGNREYLEGSIEVDVYRHAEGADPDYYHSMGQKFIVRKA